MTRHPLTASALLGSLLLGACASTPEPTAALLQARESVNMASRDSTVQTHAALELKKARDTLDRANGLLTEGAPLPDVDSKAYVAERLAQTAQAVAQAKGQDAGIAAAELDRERARADMRTRQAERAQARAGSAIADAGMARQQAASSDLRARGAEQRATSAEAAATGAQMQAAAAQAQAATAQASAAESQQQTAQLQQRLDELRARPSDRGKLVTLGDVLFQTNSANVRPGAQTELRKLADFMQQYPGRNLLIEGHTDSVGAAAANEALSRRRARAVDQALEQLGVAAQRISTTGYGEEFPVADNDSGSNRALNRRVEIYISDAGQSVRQRR